MQQHVELLESVRLFFLSFFFNSPSISKFPLPYFFFRLTGKSRLLDEIAKLRECSADELRLWAGTSVPLSDEFVDNVRNWIPLCATFNGTTSVNSTYDESKTTRLAFFSLRLLLS